MPHSSGAVRSRQLYSRGHPIIARNREALSAALQLLHSLSPAIVIGIVGVVSTLTAASGLAASFRESVSSLGSDVLTEKRVQVATKSRDELQQILAGNAARLYDFDLAALAPGVTVSEDRVNAIGFRTFSGGGSSPNQSNVFVDGSSLKNDLTGGGVAGQDASRGNPFPRNAIQEYRVITQNFKAEYCEELASKGESEIGFYTNGPFEDMCEGPHLQQTGEIPPDCFSIDSIAGAYWRGNENNPMLQRIYGTAFLNRKDLKEYLTRLEEAKKRDHRKLGKELDLFSIQDEIGSGLVLWHPKGAKVRRIIEDLWRKEHERRGYDILFTPHIAKLDLWRTSGHLDFYRENMYSPMDVENISYQIKPMTCPFHIMVYKSKLRSYKDLPFRWAEIGTVYRYERSGVLHGLLRVRGFSQDDAHIFCRPDQIEEEVLGVLDLTVFFLKVFGFDDYEVYLSTRPEKFVGSEENWEKATEALRGALIKKGLDCKTDEGGGAFYGPKIDIQLKNVLGREETVSTVQVDRHLPNQFELEFIGDDSRPHRPVMIHRGYLSTMERMISFLIEHYAGAFPAWLAPVQAAVLPVADRHDAYAVRIVDRLRAAPAKRSGDASGSQCTITRRRTWRATSRRWEATRNLWSPSST